MEEEEERTICFNYSRAKDRNLKMKTFSQLLVVLCSK